MFTYKRKKYYSPCRGPNIKAITPVAKTTVGLEKKNSKSTT